MVMIPGNSMHIACNSKDLEANKIPILAFSQHDKKGTIVSTCSTLSMTCTWITAVLFDMCPCREHLPSRQRLLYFLYALTASSLRTNTTSATPTLTRRALFRAPHTQNSSWSRSGRRQTHTGWITAPSQWEDGGGLVGSGEMHLRRCPLQSLGDAGCSLLFSSPPKDWQQAREIHRFVLSLLVLNRQTLSIWPISGHGANKSCEAKGI